MTRFLAELSSNLWRLLSARPDALPDSWPLTRIEATLHARGRLERFERERAERMERYARSWPADGRKVMTSAHWRVIEGRS